MHADAALVARIGEAVPPVADAIVRLGGTVMDDVLREVGRTRPVESLARVEAPVWLVNGRYDHFRSEERRFLRACRDGRMVVLRRARHLVSLDAPVAFSRVLSTVTASESLSAT